MTGPEDLLEELLNLGTKFEKLGLSSNDFRKAAAVIIREMSDRDGIEVPTETAEEWSNALVGMVYNMADELDKQDSIYGQILTT